MTEQNPYQQPMQPPVQPAAYYPAPPTKPAGNGFGVAALVLGIVALVFCWIPVFGLALGVLAVILGIVGLTRKDRAKGTSIAGLATGGVAVIAGVIVLIVASIAAQVITEQAGKTFEVKYTATVEGGTATVSYGSLKGASTADITDDWTKTETVNGFDGFALSVTSVDASKVTCEITVDGKSVTKQEGTTSASCTASTINP